MNTTYMKQKVFYTGVVFHKDAVSVYMGWAVKQTMFYTRVFFHEDIVPVQVWWVAAGTEYNIHETDNVLYKGGFS